MHICHHFNRFYWGLGTVVGQCTSTDLFVFCFFILFNYFFTLWSNILWFVWVLYWLCVQVFILYLFETLNIVLLSFLRFWMLCCWVFIWDFKFCVAVCEYCVVDYLFETLNVGMCGVVVFVLTEYYSLFFGWECCAFVCVVFLFLFFYGSIIVLLTLKHFLVKNY